MSAKQSRSFSGGSEDAFRSPPQVSYQVVRTRECMKSTVGNLEDLAMRRSELVEHLLEVPIRPQKHFRPRGLGVKSCSHCLHNSQCRCVPGL
jgi:hypothetical protein